MGVPFRNYNSKQATILLYGLHNTELFSKIDIYGNRSIYYYDNNYSNHSNHSNHLYNSNHSNLLLWYENPNGDIFVENYGLGSLTYTGLKYINHKMIQYNFFH